MDYRSYKSKMFFRYCREHPIKELCVKDVIEEFNEGWERLINCNND